MILAPEIYEDWKAREFGFMVNRGCLYLGQFHLERITDKAVYLEAANGHGFWCPKSIMRVIETEDSETGGIFNSVTVEIPHWVSV